MYTFAIIIEVAVAALLTLVILMQSSKGGGLAGAFGAGNMGAVFGVRRTSDFLVRATEVLATVFIVLALVINLWLLPRGASTRESVIQQSVPAPASLPPSGAPATTPNP
jgi:preprotein translocase subunit SecG